MFNFTTSRIEDSLEKLRASHQEEIQKIHDEYRRENEARDAQLEISKAYDEAEKIRTQATNDADNIRRVARDNSEMTAKDNAISEANNRADRMKSEMDARIALLEDIHADEIIALEARFEAEKKSLIEVLERKEKSFEANAQSFQNRARQDAEAAKNLAIAEGQKEANEIIARAHIEANKAYTNLLSNLVSTIKSTSVDLAGLTALVKSATENYPTTNLDGLTVHSTSSSK